MRGILVMLLALLALPAWGASPSYVLYKAVPLSRAANGVDGKVELLQDSRVTAQLRKSLWGHGEPDFVFYGSPQARMFADAPLAPALLRIVNAGGKTLREQKLDRPLADIDTQFLYGTGFPTFFVTQDYSAGTGSSGPATSLYEVRSGALTAVKLDGFLGRTLHADWKIVKAPPTAEIQTVVSHAIGTEARFVTDYSSFRFEGGIWVRHTRREAGYWEAGDWPTKEKFP